MKILYAIPTLGSGGAERQLSLIAPAIASRGIEVHVAYSKGGPNLDRLSSSGVHLHILKSSGNYDPALAWKFFQLVRRLRPDIVQTWLLQADILCGMAALLNRVPLMVSERSSASAYDPSWKTRLRTMVGRRAVGIIANSRGGMEYWCPHLAVTQLHLVRNCVSPVAPPVGESEVSLASHLVGRPVVLFAGRFSYEKNIPGLVDALILVARQNAEIMIMMFGDGPERASAVSRIANAGLTQRIVVAGYTPQLSVWLAHAAVCVSVSHFEGHPNVVMEAAAAGCPLVISDIPAHRELFDEGSVSLVPANSPTRIAEAVLETLHNPSAARGRAASARDVAVQYDLSTAADAYRSIYQQALLAVR